MQVEVVPKQSVNSMSHSLVVIYGSEIEKRKNALDTAMPHVQSTVQ